MNMDFGEFAIVGLIGVVYFFIRIIGKYAGAWLGCRIYREKPEVRNYLGLALIPQAGVAIGLAVLGQRMLPAEIGAEFYAIIICSSVLYEMIGPGLAKLALVKSGAISAENLKNPLQNPPEDPKEAIPEHLQGEDLPPLAEAP